MLAAIGETFETPYVSPSPSSSSSSAAPAPSSTSPAPLPSTFTNEITGVIVSTRKAFFRLNIWTRSSPTSVSSSSPAELDQVEHRIKNIGRHFKYGVLGFPEGEGTFAQGDKVSSDVEFQSHKDSQQKVRAPSRLVFSLPAGSSR